MNGCCPSYPTSKRRNWCRWPRAVWIWASWKTSRKRKSALSEKAKDVRITFRLTESPACLVADENELSGNLLRMLKAAGQNAPESKPILEINPDHPLVQRLKYEEAKFDDWANILFDQAALAEGGTLTDPAGFVKRVNEMLLGMAS